MLLTLLDQTEVIDLIYSAPGAFISSTYHPFIIQAGGIMLWFEGCHFGNLHKIAWSFLEEVTLPDFFIEL